MPSYEVHHRPELDAPVLVVALEGWIDAGFGAAAAVAHLLGAIPTEPLITFDGDEFIDHRARRPVMHVVDGVNSGLTWPVPQMRFGSDRTGKDLVMLIGPEPDMRWHAFTDAVVGLAAQFGVGLVVGLGAFPAPVPHTRPMRLAATATSAELAAQVGFVGGGIDVPAGVQAALERGFADAGIPAVGLWARVPHYAAPMPYPAAAASLLDQLAQLAGLEIDTRELHAAAAVTHERIQELIANSEDHGTMLRQLEEQADHEADVPLDTAGPLPSGDEIAAELERFLRGQ